jgi:hypothetical protein
VELLEEAVESWEETEDREGRGVDWDGVVAAEDMAGGWEEEDSVGIAVDV